jgi:hypothetical protein
MDDTTLWQTRLNHNQNLFGKAPDRAGATGGGAREAVSDVCQELHLHVQHATERLAKLLSDAG